MKNEGCFVDFGDMKKWEAMNPLVNMPSQLLLDSATRLIIGVGGRKQWL